jgi:hypothetical protein
MQVLGVSHTDLPTLRDKFKSLGPSCRVRLVVNPVSLESEPSVCSSRQRVKTAIKSKLVATAAASAPRLPVALYTNLKLFNQELPNINKTDGRSVILCSSIMRLIEFRGILPMDWQSTEPGVYNFKPLPSGPRLQRLLQHPTDCLVERTGKFVDLLICQLKSTSILQPILEQIHARSLSAQKASREYVFRTLAGEQVRQPASVPESINPILESDAGRRLGNVIRQIVAQKLSYSRAVAEGTDDYELRYVIKGLMTIGYKFSADINSLFWEKAQTQCKTIKNNGLVR